MTDRGMYAKISAYRDGLSNSTPNNNGTDSSDSSTLLESSLAELTERTSPPPTAAAIDSTALKSTNPPSPPVLPLSLDVATAANELPSASFTGGAIGGSAALGRDGKRGAVGLCLRPECSVMFLEAFVFAARPGESRRGGGGFFDCLAAAAG